MARIKTRKVSETPTSVVYESTIDYRADDPEYETDFQTALEKEVFSELKRAFRQLEPLGQQVDKQFEEYTRKQAEERCKKEDESEKYIRVRREGSIPTTVHRKPFIKQPYYVEPESDWVSELKAFAERAGIITGQKSDSFTLQASIMDTRELEGSLAIEGTLFDFAKNDNGWRIRREDSANIIRKFKCKHELPIYDSHVRSIKKAGRITDIYEDTDENGNPVIKYKGIVERGDLAEEIKKDEQKEIAVSIGGDAKLYCNDCETEITPAELKNHRDHDVVTVDPTLKEISLTRTKAYPSASIKKTEEVN